MRGLKAVLATAVVAGVSWFAPPAHAACHAFSFKDTTVSGTEGNAVEVIIKRDGTVNDSSVKVQSITGSATSGTDFTAVNRRVLFTGDDLEKQITVATKEDTKDEPNETFQLKLSEGQGCSNSNYTYGSNATVTINDDDAATPAPTVAPTAAPTQAPTAKPSASPTPSPTPTGSPSPTPTGSVTPSPTPSDTPSFSPIGVTEEDGGFPWIPVAAIAGFLAAAGGALALMRMRAGGGA